MDRCGANKTAAIMVSSFGYILIVLILVSPLFQFTLKLLFSHSYQRLPHAPPFCAREFSPAYRTSIHGLDRPWVPHTSGLRVGVIRAISYIHHTHAPAWRCF